MSRSAAPKPRFPLGLDQVKPLARAAGAAPGPLAKPLAPRPGTELLRPQRLLAEAARDAARLAPPSGLGLDSQAVRRRMVERLAAGGIRCGPVLDAMAAVPRHVFVDTALATQAYEDTALPIGLGQTISKPSVVARMLEIAFEGEGAARRGTLGRVLEIGTGCGYQAAVLARVASAVVSIERLKALHDKARANLAAHRHGDLRLVFGDGRLGHAPRAPYDTVIAAAGGEDVPAAWIDQLAPGGRLVAPMHDAAAGSQVLVVIDRPADGSPVQRRIAEAVHFVPLKSGTA